MSRSRKNFHCGYTAYGARPKKGKVETSRRLRRIVRQKLFYKIEEFDFAHPQDKIRGSKGSRSDDFGWDFFGDGFYVYFPGTFWYNEHKNDEWFIRRTRK